METVSNNTKDPKRCFVIMGFGIKTDFATGRQLDLNKSYKTLIKPVVESKGLICIRADEIQHSGSIDFYMYQELLDADIVIADLSTANVNAFYELGIRHALRRRTTIIISEDKLGYPFDLSHIKISNYTHLGGGIDYEEVERFRKVLGDTIDFVLKLDDSDSPVYTSLQGLTPPSILKKAAEAMEQLEKEVKQAVKKEGDDLQNGNEQNVSALSVLADEGEKALKQKDYVAAKIYFNNAVNRNKDGKNMTAHDPYLIQKLALATYKAQQPDEISSLKEAIKLLGLLDLDHTNDPETVSLAARIEKRLYEAEQANEHLTNAIEYCERGYYLLDSRYYAVNLAFLLNKRVDSSIYNTTEDKIADMVLARRTRQEVLKMCEEEWKEINKRKNRIAKEGIIQGDHELTAEQQALENEQKFWIMVNKAEAYFGLGQMEEYKKAVAEAKEIEHEDWMMKSLEEQIAELRALMQKHGHLLSPAWSEV